MALSIMYCTGADLETGQAYGWCIETAAVTLGGASATCGTIPAGAKIARVKAGEACYVSNNNVAASATNGFTLAADEVVDIAVPNGGGPFLARTA